MGRGARVRTTGVRLAPCPSTGARDRVARALARGASTVRGPSAQARWRPRTLARYRFEISAVRLCTLRDLWRRSRCAQPTARRTARVFLRLYQPLEKRREGLRE